MAWEKAMGEELEKLGYFYHKILELRSEDETIKPEFDDVSASFDVRFSNGKREFLVGRRASDKEYKFVFILPEGKRQQDSGNLTMVKMFKKLCCT